jgi:hypothetical protein
MRCARSSIDIGIASRMGEYRQSFAKPTLVPQSISRRSRDRDRPRARRLLAK